ncbi:MAG: hypothetical protein ACXWWM_07450 [Candidatus Deferrimicrobiaceae bacterium]
MEMFRARKKTTVKGTCPTLLLPLLCLLVVFRIVQDVVPALSTSLPAFFALS